MAYNAKNYNEQGAEKMVIGGELVILESATLEVEDGATVTGVVAAAKATALGGVKAATRNSGNDTVEIKIDSSTSKLYAPTYPVLPTAATEEDAGIVKMAANVEEAEGAVGVDDFNGLLAALIAAGLMAPAPDPNP